MIPESTAYFDCRGQQPPFPGSRYQVNAAGPIQIVVSVEELQPPRPNPDGSVNTHCVRSAAAITPAEYLEIERQQTVAIAAAQRAILFARLASGICPPPAKLRPATAADITLGAIIWYPDPANTYWQVVREVLNPSGDYKGYYGFDGCRYGLARAFVEVVEQLRDTAP